MRMLPKAFLTQKNQPNLVKITTKFLSIFICIRTLIESIQYRYPISNQVLAQWYIFKKSMPFFLKFKLRLLHKIPNKCCLLILLFCASMQLSAQVTPLEASQYSAQFDQILNSEVADSDKFQFLLDNINKIDPYYSNLPFTYINRGIALATAKNEIEWRGELYCKLGDLYGDLSKKDSAEVKHELALLDFKEVQNSQRILDTHHTLSQTYGSNDRMDKALEHAYATIAICEKTGNKNELARANLNIAGTLYNLNEAKRAVPFAKKSLAIYKENNDPSGQVTAATCLALYYTDSLDLALDYLDKSSNIIKNDPQLNNASAWIHYYCNRISLSKRMKDYEKVAHDLNLVDSLSADGRDLNMQQYLDFNKAVNAHDFERYEASKKLLLKNINDSLASINPYLTYNYEYLTNNYIKLNRWDSAYHYHMVIHDMENKEKIHESKQTMEALKTQYETEKKEATILAQNQRITQQRIIQWLAIGFAALLGLLLFQSIKNAKIKNRANKRLQELDTLKTKLYANITHEFRTPLTIIGGMATQVQENPEKWLDQGLVMIQRNTNRLLDLVNQMLDLSKLKSGKLSLQNQQSNLISYLKYIVESIHSFAESNKIQIHFHSEVEELMMDYDAERIQQIMVNLLSNAVKFTPEAGHVYVFVNTIPKKDSPQKTQMLQVKVKDTGIGISENQLPFIFDRFHQVDDSTTRANEGTGIGLALVKELVKLMEGDISVKNNSDKQQREKGTEFTLLLPISNVAPKIQTVLSVSKYERINISSLKDKITLLEKEESELLLDTNKPSVLIVEDNHDVVTYITSCLQDQYDIMVANNGEEGINFAIENIPDLIITDVMMPIKDGYEVCKTLKTDQHTSHIPIIMLTAKADMESKMEGLRKGADAYLAKPFHKKELLLRIKKLVELRKKLQQHYLSIAASTQPLPPTKDQPEIPAADSQFVHELKAIVELYLSDVELNVEKICTELKMSQSQLYRKTSALTGLSPNKFIRFIRLNKAKVMLKNPDINISEAAYNTGFNDPSYFGRVFKKEFGITPLQWKESNVTIGFR